MKLPSYLTSLLALGILALGILALTASGQGYTPNPAAEASHQRQQLEQQRLDIQRLQEEQRRTARAAADACYYTYRPVKVPERYPSPIQTPVAPAAQDRTHIDRYIQRVMANPTLSHAAKLRIVRPLLGE